MYGNNVVDYQDIDSRGNDKGDKEIQTKDHSSIKMLMLCCYYWVCMNMKLFVMGYPCSRPITNPFRSRYAWEPITCVNLEAFQQSLGLNVLAQDNDIW